MPRYRDSAGRAVIVENGKVQVRDQNGNVFEVPVQSYESTMAQRGDLAPALENDLHAYDTQRKHAGLGGATAAGAEAFAAGAIDAAQAPIRLPVAAAAAAVGVPDPLAPIGGRETLESAVALGSEATGGEGEAAAREYAEGARGRAEANPEAAFGGRVLGEVTAGAGLSRAASVAGGLVGGGLRRAAATGALEGAGLGYAQASEDAYLRDTELTSEQAWAAMGLGAAFGGGVALGLGGASRVFGRRGSRGLSPVDSPKLGPYRTHETDLEQVAENALGTPAAPGLGGKVREFFEDLQSAATGADRKALRETGALRWDDQAIRARDMWTRREEILEGATGDLTQRIEALEAKARGVLDEVVDAGLKREHVAKKLTGDRDLMLAAAREEIGRLQVEARGIAGELSTPEQAFRDWQKSKGIKPGIPDEDLYGNARLAKNTAKYMDGLAGLANTTDDAAEAFIALDRAKRALQRERVALGRSASREADAFKRQQTMRLGQEYERMQERTRQLLMNEDIWGKAAADQRAINSQWERFFESNRMFGQNFLARVGETFDGRPIMAADPKRVASYVRGLGKQESALVDTHFRSHVAAVRDLTGAIDNAFDLGPKAADVRAVRDAAEQIQATLAAADRTVKVSNQIDAIIAADSSTGAFGGALAGGVVGGPVGAALGAGFGAILRPGSMLRTAAAVQALRRNVDAQITRGLRGFFSRSSARTAERAPLKLSGGSRATTRRGVTAGALAFANPGESRRKAYERRAREVIELANNPQLAAERVERATGKVSENAPKLAGMLGMKAIAGAAFLVSKLPAGIRGPSLMPHLDRTGGPSDSEIDRFQRYWLATTNPLGVLDELRKGTLKREHVETLQAVWPALYAQIQARALELIASAETKPSYQARLSLDMMLGLNGGAEPSVSPSFLAQMSKLSTDADAAAGVSGMPRRPMPPPKYGTLTERSQTGSAS